jgi:lipoprotein-anchoring transpeptidase ErfK/SrfK
VGAVAAALMIAGTAGCTHTPATRWQQPAAPASTPGNGGGGTVSTAPSSFRITPAADSANVSVLDPVTVAAQDGKLETVAVTNPAGKQVQGGWDATHTTWHTTEDLGYGKRYTVHATGATSAGQPLEQVSAFTTLKPAAQMMPSLQANHLFGLQEGGTYGVGQPIAIHFDRNVPDRAAVQRLLTVTTNPPVEGAWSWIDAQNVHYRPETYWAPGTTVAVKAKLYGKDLGKGTYAQADVSGSFKIGPSKIAVADNDTKHMQVLFDGKPVRDIRVSMGRGGTTKNDKGQTINYSTNSGPHVVLGKTPKTTMSSSSYGVTDPKNKFYYPEETVYLTVRISDSGEYVHLADWNVEDHGIRNSSHGCINVGPADAQWFYDNFGPGDIVNVKGTPVNLLPGNGLGDWGVSWSDWKKGSAL